MKDDPVESWMWSQKEIADGAVQESSKEKIFGIFKVSFSSVGILFGV